MSNLFHNIRTFHRSRMSYVEALDLQPMILPVIKEVMDNRFPKIQLAVDCFPLVELWDGLMGVPDVNACQTMIPFAIDSTMPPEYIPVIRGIGGVVAAYAFCELAKTLVRIQDFRDDLALKDAFLDGWRAFEERRQAANDVQHGFGCDESQSWLTLKDIEDRSGDKNLVRKITAIARLAGRMYEHFGYHRKDAPNENPEEVTGAKQGGELERVLPTELALLADEETADMQAMKILQGHAPVLEMKGTEAKNRGPLVAVVDESGSMDDSGMGYYSTNRTYAGRNTWAKACCVALTRIAWQENRPVKVVHFGYGTEVQDVPKDDYRAMFEMARSFLGGGTCFGSALKRGQLMVTDLEREGYEGADIVLITDGQDPDHDAQNEQIDKMDANGVKLWTVAIGEKIPKTDPVRARAERYTFASDQNLNDPNTAVQLATGLDKAAMGNDPNDPKTWN